MGVYIQGINIPANCQNCRIAHRGGCSLVMDEDGGRPVPLGGRPDWCPMTEVLSPHGRLIDADALIESNKFLRYDPSEHKEGSYDEGWAVGFNAGAAHATEHAVYAKTVIPAEREE